MPKLLIFDSGLGGLSVLPHLHRAHPQADYVYAADDAAFPYGGKSEAELIARISAVIDELIGRTRPDIAVIACSTASTLILPDLRKNHSEIRFVGVVPAVKPAAQASRSHQISVLATPGTVSRAYTHSLVREFAAHCQVTLVGAPRLAMMAEAFMRGAECDLQALAQEIEPAFVEKAGARTDHIVLACTHYPLLLDQFERIAPWSVNWIDPAAAIARRVSHLLHELGFAESRGAQLGMNEIWFSSGQPPDPALVPFLARNQLEWSPWRFPYQAHT